MALQDIKENLKNQLEQLGERITNSRLYGILQDRYENLSTPKQRIAKIFSVLLIIGLLIYIPLDYFIVSFDQEISFEEKRKLIKDIIRSERDINALPDIPRPLPAESIKANIESQLKEMNLIPEQIKQITINNSPTSGLVPAGKIQYGVDVLVHKINVKQLTNLGSKLQIIHPAVKVKDMIITLNREDARYLNAEFKLIALNIPEYKKPEPPPEPPKKKGSKKTTKTTEEE